MNRCVAGLAVSALAVGSLMVATTPPAAAVDGVAGKLNMWQNDSYEGQTEARESYDSDLHNDSCSGCDPGPGGNFGDDMSSYTNKSGYWWYLYVDDNYDGKTYCARPRSHDADLGNNGYSDLEDEISSVKRGPAGSFGSSSPGSCDVTIGIQN